MKAGKQQPIAVPVLEADRIQMVPVSMLVPDPNQPRTEFPEHELREFGEVLKQRGVRVPLIVRSDWVIEDGERRWRAAELVGIEALPCTLAKPAAEEQPDLERLLDQAAINDHREPLSVLDWSRLLRRLTDDHQIPVKDLPELLAARGFKRLSRSHISNIMRLDDLPDWAQDLIRDGQLTPSDGKYLLMAKPFPKALQWILDTIKDEQKRLKEGETLHEGLFKYEYEDMEQLVQTAYRDTAICLSTNYGNNAPLFKWPTSCKACDKRQAINKSEYCLDAVCFEQKQEQARAALKAKGKTEDQERVDRVVNAKPKKPTGPTKVKPDENGVVNVSRLSSDKYHNLQGYGVRFEPAIHCVGCEHNRPAIRYKSDGQPGPHCFNPPCFAEKQRNGNREEGIAQWLDQRLLPQVLAKLTNNYDLQFQLLAWMALGGPTQTDDEREVGNKLRTESRRAQRHLGLRNPGAVIQAYTAGNFNGEAIAAAGVRALLADRAHFYAFARHLGIQLTPAIASLDADYLDLKRKPELLALLNHAGQPDEDLITGAALSKAKLNDIVEHCLSAEVIQAVGVPPDVQALYDHLEPVFDLDDEDLDEDEDDVSGETEAYDQGGEDTPTRTRG